MIDIDTASRMILVLAEHFGIEPEALTTVIMLLSKKNTAMADKKK